MQPPDIQSGPVPDWITEGMRLVRERRRVVLRVSPAFDMLSPAEQEAALASVLVASDLARRGRWWFWVALIPAWLVFALAYGIVSGLLGFSDRLLFLAAFAIYVIIPVAVYAIWLRRVAYQHDRELSRMMGRPAVDLLLGLDARKRPELRGSRWSTSCWPLRTKLVERNDWTFWPRSPESWAGSAW